MFILAGIYQLTPFKYACLSHCRSPFAFVLNHWRDGWIGALRMGASHGLYCLGCCWVLMALLFAVGVMNLVWVAAIAAFVFAEKLLPGGIWVGRIGGGAMAALVSYQLTLVTFCTKIPSDHSWNDGCLLEPLGCGGGSATGFGQVVAIGACDALDHPDVEQPA